MYCKVIKLILISCECDSGILKREVKINVVEFCYSSCRCNCIYDKFYDLYQKVFFFFVTV